MILFKQKTAYEMRISDWSSDVCSSDLVDQHQIGPVTLLPLRILLLRTSEAALQHFAHHRKIVARHCLCPFDVALAIGVFAETQIGRASCRERVFKYVYISVVAVSLTQQYKTTTSRSNIVIHIHQ